MRFGENSRKGASSLIVVMLVAVIALAGTAVYVALDRTVLTTDGYALPGSTVEYAASENSISASSVATIVGYSDGTYYSILTNMYGDDDYIDEHFPIPDNLDGESVKVNVPGLGMTDGMKYTITSSGVTGTVTTILHGLIYSMEAPTISLTISSSDIDVGNYDDASITTSTFVRSGSSNTIVVECISQSTDGGFLYCVRIPSSTYSEGYYIGNASKIPSDLGNNTTYTVHSESGFSATLTISNGAITQISQGGQTYVPQTSSA